jgi:hypothetical protein
MSSDYDENEPYNRWQGFRINQLGLCISLFLTFAVATLGFSVNLLVQPTFPITVCFARVIFLLSLVLGSISLLFGSLACLTRLADFRLTAKVVRHRSDPSMNSRVDLWREQYDKFGRWTWRLFYGQLGLFGLQIFGLMLALIITYWRKLIL